MAYPEIKMSYYNVKMTYPYLEMSYPDSHPDRLSYPGIILHIYSNAIYTDYRITYCVIQKS